MIRPKNSTTGKIIGIENAGTIVLVYLKLRNRRVVLVPFDHSPFRWMLDAQGCRASDLIGRKAKYRNATATFEIVEE